MGQNEKSDKKIAQRETLEIERTKKLILKCKYSSYNCPEKLRPLHSVVLALNLDTEPNNLIKPKETGRLKGYDGPVFNINKKTNNVVTLRRMRIKSVRKRNFEYLMRQVSKDMQGETLQYDELRTFQENIKNIQDGLKKEKAKHSKYSKIVTAIVDKLKSVFKPKKLEPKKSEHEISLSKAINKNRADITETADQPESKSLRKIKNTPKRGLKESKNINPKSINCEKLTSNSKNLKTTSLRDTRILAKSQSRVSFEELIT